MVCFSEIVGKAREVAIGTTDPIHFYKQEKNYKFNSKLKADDETRV